MVGVRAFGRAQAHGRGRLRLRAGARGNFRLSRAARLRPLLFRPQGRGRAHRCGDLEGDLRPHPVQARGRARGHRHRPAHHLSGPLVLPDRHRQPGARRRRRPDGAVGGAQEEARRRRPVRRGAQAAAALSAGRDRHRHLADRRGDPRHPAPARRPLSAPRAGVAGAGARRGLGRRGGGGDPRLQRAARGRRDPAAGSSTRRSWCAPPPTA